MMVVAFLCSVVVFNLSSDATGIKIVPIIFASALGVIAIVYTILATIGLISLSVRRCHDIGLSGWVYPLCMIGNICCGLGSVVWLVLCFFDSKEDNKWGPNPKSPENNIYSGYGSIILSVIMYIALHVIFVVGILVLYFYLLSASLSSEHKGIESYAPEILVPGTKVFSGTDWESYEVLVDGNIIKLPCDYSYIQALGYTVVESDDYILYESLNSNGTGDRTYHVEDKQGRGFGIKSKNQSGFDELPQECDIFGISFEDSYDLPDIEICGGLRMGMTYDEVKSLYGEPDDEYSDNSISCQVLYYYQDGQSYYGDLQIVIFDGVVYNITLENLSH